MRHKVLLDVTPLFNPNPRGIGTYILQLINSFRGINHGFEILLGYKVSRMKYWKRMSRIPKGLKSGPFIDRPFFFFPYSFNLFHGTDRFLPDGEIAKVLTVHDLLPLYNEMDFLDPGTRDLMRRKIYLTFEKNPLGIIAVSEFVKEEIARFFSAFLNRVVVIPHGVSPEFRKCEEYEVKKVLDFLGIERPYLLFVGEPERRKNLHGVLGAFESLIKRFSKLKLVLVGAEIEFFPKEVVKLMEPVEGKVIIIPFVNIKILRALYNGAELFVFPTLYEGFGLPVLEAMACGTPVLISNHPALVWVAGEAAFSVSGDANSIRNGVEQILEDRELRNLLVAKGLKRAKEFDWRKTAFKTLEIYRKIC